MHIFLDDLDDPRLAPYHQLPRVAETIQGRQFVVEGRWLVERLAQSRHRLLSVLVDEAHANDLPVDVGQQTPIFVLPSERVDQLVGFKFHRGMLACGQQEAADSLENVVPPPPAKTLIVVCVNVVDPVNLGGIVRNAAAFGGEAVLVDRLSADPFSRRVIRVSMGAALEIPILRSTGSSLQPLLAALELQQIERWGAVLDSAAMPLDTVEPPGRVALLVGNEGFGLDSASQRSCDRLVTIPLPGRTDSLNAAVASGILLYHFSLRA